MVGVSWSVSRCQDSVWPLIGQILATKPSHWLTPSLQQGAPELSHSPCIIVEHRTCSNYFSLRICFNYNNCLIIYSTTLKSQNQQTQSEASVNWGWAEIASLASLPEQIQRFRMSNVASWSGWIVSRSTTQLWRRLIFWAGKLCVICCYKWLLEKLGSGPDQSRALYGARREFWVKLNNSVHVLCNRVVKLLWDFHSRICL